MESIAKNNSPSFHVFHACNVYSYNILFLYNLHQLYQSLLFMNSFMVYLLNFLTQKIILTVDEDYYISTLDYILL